MAASSGAGSLPGFSEATGAWFNAAFAEPTRAQSLAWQSIGNGEHTLVIAPTGSGKTLAAFLWAIDKLASEPVPANPRHRCRVLYISPMKALAVDVERNLRSPLTGVRHAARRLGLAEPDITVAVRTGDTAADERRKMSSKPPDILITTPESLFLLLTSQARESLRGVQTVIVDEVHALAGGKRGAHLALSLERLDALRMSAEPRPAGPAQRIGLSATVRPPEEVATFLGGALPVTIVAPPSEKRLDLQIVVPVEDMADLQTTEPAGGPQQDAPGGPEQAADQARQHSIWPHVEARVLDLIEAHRSTIVFANSRGLAERLCGRLNDLATERAAEAGQEGNDTDPGGFGLARMPWWPPPASSSASTWAPWTWSSRSSRRHRWPADCSAPGGPGTTSATSPAASSSPSTRVTWSRPPSSRRRCEPGRSSSCGCPAIRSTC
jgi:ATP-dependent Lhr-like helicase